MEILLYNLCLHRPPNSQYLNTEIEMGLHSSLAELLGLLAEARNERAMFVLCSFGSSNISRLKICRMPSWHS